MTVLTLVRSIRPLFAILLVAGCATGPIDYPRNYSVAEPPDTNTRFARELAEWYAANPEHAGRSAFYPLVGGNDAFGARLALADMAERSIDVQYFLMKPDSAGLVFSASLLEAADRGVRVRFLLDDVFTTVKDSNLELLDQHPNIEVRIFNPIGRGGFYYANYLADFKRANRRMHNKSFTVDNAASIVGGRNIADEYFELKQETEFRDFDMLALGDIAVEISATFDRFWNHKLSVPVAAFRSGSGRSLLTEARADVTADERARAEAIHRHAIESDLVQQLVDDAIPLFIGDSEIVTDDPEKLLNNVSPDQQILVTRLAEMVANAESEVVVATPYFIPGRNGVEFWRSVVDNGVRVVIVTNSLASNNHVPVHAAYARYRHDIIQAGVELYELRVDATDIPENPNEEQFDAVTLHTKAVIIDRRHTAIGSLNLDPRSIDINTEMALLIDSPALAEAIVVPALERIQKAAYRLSEDENGKLNWTASIDGVTVVETNEPQSGNWRRFKAFLSRILPESQL
jgi:putative cardiolipin synthase